MDAKCKTYEHILILLLLVLLTLVFLLQYQQSNPIIPSIKQLNNTVYLVDLEKRSKFVKKKQLLDGCHHVYLDVGTNIGIQV